MKQTTLISPYVTLHCIHLAWENAKGQYQDPKLLALNVELQLECISVYRSQVGRVDHTFSFPQAGLSKSKLHFLSSIEPFQTAACMCQLCLSFFCLAQAPGAVFPATEGCIGCWGPVGEEGCTLHQHTQR